MYDGLKLRTVDPVSIQNISQSPLLIYTESKCSSTGVQITVYRWRGLFFHICAGQVVIRGSISRFYNNGKRFNGRFTFDNFVAAIELLEQTFKTSRHVFSVHNVEVGFVISTEQHSKTYLSRIIALLGSKVAPPLAISKNTPRSIEYGHFYRYQQYAYKLYVPELSHRPSYKLRIELRIVAMQKVLHLCVRKLTDLFDERVIVGLQTEFFNCFADLLIIENLPAEKMKGPARKLCQEVSICDNWLKWSPKTRYRKKNAFYDLLNIHNVNGIKNELLALLREQQDLFNADFTNWVSNKDRVRIDAGYDTCTTECAEVGNLSMKLNLDNDLIDTLSNNVNDITRDKNIDCVCQVCGKDISHQKKDSKYCSDNRRCRDRMANREKKRRREIARGFIFDFDKVTKLTRPG